MTSSFVPVGDPDGMRDLALELQGRAELIATSGVAATGALDDSTFEGPAAERLRGTLAGARSDVLLAASRLRDIANGLVADAASVERQNEELKRAAAAAEAAAQAAAHPPAPGAATGATSPPTGVPTSETSASTPAAPPIDPAPSPEPAAEPVSEPVDPPSEGVIR